EVRGAGRHHAPAGCPRPAGRDGAAFPPRAGLRERERRPDREDDPPRRRRARPGDGPGPGRRDVPPLPRQPGHRGLHHRAAGAGSHGMSTRVAIVLFPGTNCELDVAWALEQLGAPPEIVFHLETNLHGADAVVVPGGFAHGDYLRTGALARFSPVMDAVAAFAADGGPVAGICNGFQVLTEAGL